MHNNDHVQAWIDFFLAYGQQQAALAQHLSAQSELERRSRILYRSLAKQYENIPPKIVAESPYGTLLLTLDFYSQSIREIEDVTVI